MTRARRVSEGERTHSERTDDFGPDGTYTSGEKTAEARAVPERLCKRCEALANPHTAYGLVISTTGLGHEGLTLCGKETGDWPAPTT